MAPYLVVVARHQPALGHYLKRSLAGDENVEVVVDRRWGARRLRNGPHAPERRRSERRSRLGLDSDLHYQSFFIAQRAEVRPGDRPARNGDGPHRWLPDGLPAAPAGGAGVEIVRHGEGPIEVKLSGLVGAAERRTRRWRAATFVLLVGLVVGASFSVAGLALRWDYERGRTVQLLRVDLEVARARARCWEALPRHWPRSPKDVIVDAKRTEWVRRCVTAELTRLNSSR